MKKYNWFQKIGLSLVPGEFYFHILNEKIGRAIGYMVLFILVLSLGVGFYTGMSTKSGIDATLADYEKGLIPSVSIQNDQLEVAGDQVVIIDHFNTKVIMDDEGIYDVNDALIYDDFILFQQSGIGITSGGVGPIVYSYEDLIMFDLTGSDVATILRVMAIMMVPTAIISQFFIALISFLLNSVFVLMMGNISRTIAGLKLKLSQVYHMVIYAMTFSVFWTHFTALLPGNVPMWLDNFVYFAIPSLILINVYMMMRKKALEKQ